MFLSTPVKIFGAALLLPLIFAGCSFWRNADNTSLAAPAKKSAFPFSTHEPDTFQTDIVIRTGEAERHITIARDGEKRRIDYDVDTDAHRAVIVSDKEYAIDFKRKQIRERELSGSGTLRKEVAGFLNVRDYVEFEEVAQQGSIHEYRGRINESDASQVSIFFDESIGLPVRQEFYSVNGDERKLQYSVELRDFRREVDPSVFVVPAGFKKVDN